MQQSTLNINYYKQIICYILTGFMLTYIDEDKNTQKELQIFFAVSEPSVKHGKGKACQKEHGNHNDYI